MWYFYCSGDKESVYHWNAHIVQAVILTVMLYFNCDVIGITATVYTLAVLVHSQLKPKTLPNEKSAEMKLWDYSEERKSTMSGKINTDIHVLDMLQAFFNEQKQINNRIYLPW